MRSDVLIIGGGVIGLAIARELHLNGIGDVAVVDAGRPGRESSWAAAGLLAPQAEADAADDFFEMCRQSNRLFTEFAARLLEETGIDIELDDSGTIYAAFTEEDLEEIDQRFRWQSAAKLPVEKLTPADIHGAEPEVSAAVRGGLLFPEDRQVENRRLVAALEEYAARNGIAVMPETGIVKLESNGAAVKGVSGDGRRFEAATAVVATGAWTSLIKFPGQALEKLAIRPIRGQMVSYGSGAPYLKRVIYSPRGYLVPRRSGNVLAGATVEDVGFDSSVTESGSKTVIRNAEEIAPSLSETRVVEEWAGLRPKAAADGLPVIGSISGFDNVFVAAGHYRNGILLSPLTARMIAGKIAENTESKYLDIFGPARFASSHGSSGSPR